MKLRKFENFGQDEQEFDVHGLGAQEAQEGHEDAEAFAGEETQEEETLELDEVVNKILAAVEEDKAKGDSGETQEEEEEGQDLRSKITAILADFHSSEEHEEDFEGEDFEGESEEGEDFGFASHSGDFGGDDSEHEMPKFEGLKKFNNFK
jgi:hypothetical protein